jgi:hypothetical protein
MSKQAAATLALGIAGAIITCVFAFMCLKLHAGLWGWASLITGVCTVWKLSDCTKPEQPQQNKPNQRPEF